MGRLPGQLPGRPDTVTRTAFLACALLISATPVAAEDQTSCAGTDLSQCVPFAGCYGLDGTYFHGAAWANNSLFAKRSDGVHCAGLWEQTSSGLGKASFHCGQSETAQVIYFIQDNRTGTVVGSGYTSKSQKVLVWSGANLAEFFAINSENGLPEMTCGPVKIPVS